MDMVRVKNWVIFGLVGVLFLVGWLDYSTSRLIDAENEITTEVLSLGGKEIDNQIISLDRTFDMQMDQNPVKVKQWYDKAKRIEEISDSASIAIKELINNSTEPITANEIQTLKSISQKARSAILSASKDWKGQEFDHNPLSYIKLPDKNLKILSKGQVIDLYSQNIRRLVYEANTYLIGNISTTDFICRSIFAKAIPECHIIKQGDSIKAKIFLGEYLYRYKMNGRVGNRNIKGEDGVSTFKVNEKREGLHKISGTVSIDKPSGQKIELPFNDNFLILK